MYNSNTSGNFLGASRTHNNRMDTLPIAPVFKINNKNGLKFFDNMVTSFKQLLAGKSNKSAQKYVLRDNDSRDIS